MNHKHETYTDNATGEKRTLNQHIAAKTPFPLSKIERRCIRKRLREHNHATRIKELHS